MLTHLTFGLFPVVGLAGGVVGFQKMGAAIGFQRVFHFLPVRIVADIQLPGEEFYDVVLPDPRIVVKIPVKSIP